MATQIIIRNLDPDVVDRLAAKAADAGQSLQAYMAELATANAATLSTAELIDRARQRAQVSGRTSPSRQQILEALAGER